MKHTKLFNLIKAQLYLKFPNLFENSNIIKNNRRARPVVIIDLNTYRSYDFTSINQAAKYLDTETKIIWNSFIHRIPYNHRYFLLPRTVYNKSILFNLNLGKFKPIFHLSSRPNTLLARLLYWKTLCNYFIYFVLFLFFLGFLFYFLLSFFNYEGDHNVITNHSYSNSIPYKYSESKLSKFVNIHDGSRFYLINQFQDLKYNNDSHKQSILDLVNLDFKSMIMTQNFTINIEKSSIIEKTDMKVVFSDTIKSYSSPSSPHYTEVGLNSNRFFSVINGNLVKNVLNITHLDTHSMLNTQNIITNKSPITPISELLGFYYDNNKDTT